MALKLWYNIFTPNVELHIGKSYDASKFAIRLWIQKELLEQLFAHYDKLDDDPKAELPLKRIWTVAAQEDN